MKNTNTNLQPSLNHLMPTPGILYSNAWELKLIKYLLSL
jgi:hypothetical protein